MWQWFHTELNDTILFEGWTVTDPWMMAVACCVIFLIGILFEGTKWFRKRAKEHFQKGEQTERFANAYLNKACSIPHLVDCTMFLLQLIIGYVLMLIFMSFSVWLGLAVVLGATTGFIIFGDR